MTRAIVRWAALVVLGSAVQSGTALADTQTRTSSFTYDATSGLLTQEVVEPDTPALRLQTGYTHDAFGNRVSVTVSGVDIVSRSAGTTYSANGQFATGASNALGQSDSTQYDARFGQPTSHTGPNGLTTTASYDGFGRKTLETLADGTKTSFSYLFCNGVNGGTAACPSGASYLIKMTPLAADGVTQNDSIGIVYFDHLDRELASDTQGFDGSTVRTATQYDALGRVWKTSRPYFVSGGAPQWTVLTYDALGRVVTAAEPDGGVSQIAYHGLSVMETNAKNQTLTITKNSQDNVVSVTDALSNTMTHAYDAMSNLTQTIDAAGNVVTASYDLRGRKTANSDPDLGAWTYSYNTLGEVVSQTDAKSQTATFSYDKLGRMLQRVEPDMTAVWVYDTATNGIGQLASASITSGPGSGFQRTMSYDALGRPSQVATTIDSATYTMSASYDANGWLNTVTYPSGFVARYAYNSFGYVNQLLDHTTSLVHYTANARDAEQNLTQVIAGNGLVTTRTFNATNGRVANIATGSANAVQNFAYTYDLLGNPLSRTDANTSLSESFTYDVLNRLTSSTVGFSPMPLVKSFTYSAIGNMLSKSDVGTYTYPSSGSPRPHAVASISGGPITTSFTYDSNGNQTSGLGRDIAWTSYNKPLSITQGTRTISFLDDIDYQRFKQVTPEGTTLYLSAFGVLAELSNPGAPGEKWTEYLSIGGIQVGMRVVQTATSTVATRYFHTDHLGSISVITNEAGAVAERLSYDAEGKRRHPDGNDDATGSITSQSTRGFTGEEQLSVAGLVHLNGRVYDPFLARMTSADPIVDGPLSSQGWNRYSYVHNRPLASTDPTGFQCECPDWAYNNAPPSLVMTPPPPGSSGWSWGPAPLPAPTVFPEWTPPPIAPLPPPPAFDPWAAHQAFQNQIAADSAFLASQPPSRAPAAPASGSSQGGLSPGSGAGRGIANGVQLAAGREPPRIRIITITPGPTVVDPRGRGGGGAAGLVGAARGVSATAKFAQRTFNRTFSKGGIFARRSVEGVAAALRSRTMKPSDVPINYIIRDGQTIILNTRSAKALEAAGIPRSEWSGVNKTGDPFFENLLNGQLGRNPGGPFSTVRPSQEGP